MLEALLCVRVSVSQSATLAKSEISQQLSLLDGLPWDFLGGLKFLLSCWPHKQVFIHSIKYLNMSKCLMDWHQIDIYGPQIIFCNNFNPLTSCRSIISLSNPLVLQVFGIKPNTCKTKTVPEASAVSRGLLCVYYWSNNVSMPMH